MGANFYKEVLASEFLTVRDFFNSYSKAEKWFECPNPLLGGLSPMEMFYPKKRREKLNRFIKNQIMENHGL